jgi:hypothetical protein
MRFHNACPVPAQPLSGGLAMNAATRATRWHHRALKDHLYQVRHKARYRVGGLNIMEVIVNYSQPYKGAHK